MEPSLESLENSIGADWDYREPEDGRNSAYFISMRDTDMELGPNSPTCAVFQQNPSPQMSESSSRKNNLNVIDDISVYKRHSRSESATFKIQFKDFSIGTPRKFKKKDKSGFYKYTSRPSFPERTKSSISLSEIARLNPDYLSLPPQEWVFVDSSSSINKHHSTATLVPSRIAISSRSTHHAKLKRYSTEMLSLNSNTYSKDFKSSIKRLSRSRSSNFSNYPKLRMVV